MRKRKTRQQSAIDTLCKSIRVRILGVNCPETHGAEKEAGLAVRGYVEKVLAGFPMHLLSMEKPDKFGRVLGDIVDLDGVRIMDTGLCTLLIALGFAKVYHGEKKQPFTAEECAAIVAKVREVMGDA